MPLEYFDVVDGAIDEDKFIGLLQKLRHDADTPIFVIPDNARCHSKKARTFLETQEGQSMMALMPPCSPD
jgi:hypothetical protein